MTGKMSGTMRLNKFISNNGSIARRTAEEYIRQGRVTINNMTVTDPAFNIIENKDKVRVDGELVKTSRKKVYIVLNKPRKVISGVSDDKHRTTVTDLIKSKEKIFPVGRLDYDTSGLILLTNDGEFANRLMHPRYKVEKTYRVKLSKPIEEKHKLLIQKGVRLGRKVTAPAYISFINPKDKRYINITIHEGMNRQVRKVFESFGYFVDKLERIKYGYLTLRGLASEQWRHLEPKEIQSLTKICKPEEK